MRRKTTILACVLIAAVWASSGGRAQQPEPPAEDGLAKALEEAARENYERLRLETLDEMQAPDAPRATQILDERRAESLYIWSRRWLEAEIRRHDGGDREAVVAAWKAHLGRVKTLESGEFLAIAAKDVGKPFDDERDLMKTWLAEECPNFVKPLKYFRLEAEAGLADAVKARNAR